MPSLTEIRQNCLERAKMESSDFCRSVMVGAVGKTKQQYMGETDRQWQGRSGQGTRIREWAS